MSILKLNINIQGGAQWMHRGKLVQARNTFTYKAGDLIANALSRNGPFQVTHLYCRFNGPSTVSALGPSDLRTVTRSHFLASASLSGGFYVPVLTAPGVSSSNLVLYNGNRLSFYFRIPSSVGPDDHGMTNEAEFSLEDSRISAMGLAVAQSASDRTQDLMLSVLQGGVEGGGAAFEMFPLVNGGQTAIDYPINIAFE